MTQHIGPRVCPHGANPQACITCYNLAQRQKVAQPPPQRTSLEPQIAKGKVIGATDNPLLAAQIAKKNAALGVTPEMLQAQQPQPAGPTVIRQDAPATGTAPAPRQPAPQQRRASTQQPSNPHAGVSYAEETPNTGGGVYVDIAELERMFPKHDSIIDRQSTHPNAPQPTSRGTINPGRGGGSSRPAITKGRRPG